MFNENLQIGSVVKDEELLNLLTHNKEAMLFQLRGDHTDKIFKKGKLVDVIEGHNTVVTTFLKLVTCLLKNQSGYSGIQYWAIGSGASSWDTTLPNPVASANKLTAEIGRVALTSSDIKFLNASFNEVTTPTNILQIKKTFSESMCNGVWREFGIFGGNATTTKDSGIMVNKRHHGVITKTSELSIERTLRFTLTLS